MLGNLLTPSPDVLKAQKEQKMANQNVRSEELKRLHNLLDDFTNEKKIAGLLPDDVEYAKKFLKSRITTIQSAPAMTEDQLLILKSNKESQNFDHFYDSLKERAAFYKEFDGYKFDYTNKTDELKKKGKPVPPEFGAAIKTSEEGLAWVKKYMFETPDVYDDKAKQLKEQFNAKYPQATLGNPDKDIKNENEKCLEKRESFSIGRLIRDVSAYVGGYFVVFLIFVTMFLGSSLATNLNVYKNWAYRLLYAVYGGIFCLLVIPYVLGYRWAFLGKQPKFYSLIPLFPYHWDSRIMQILFGWISYRPDTDIERLREWEI